LNIFGTIYDLLYGIIPGVLFLKSQPYYRRKESSKQPQSDADLIAEYKKTQQKHIIGILFDRYIHVVFASCMKYHKNEDDAQDAAMEIFEALSEKLLKHDIEYFKSWLYTTTRNHCLMQLRKKKVFERFENIDKIDQLFVENESNLHHNIDEEQQVIKKYLSELKEEQRICLELMYFQGLSYKDVAEKTGFELKHVKSYLQNGKRNLKLLLEQYYEEQSRI
jgi:RNA polymerase sigma-70 factor, ECF subfamily